MKIDLTALVQAIIVLFAALITGYVIPWVKSKTTENQQKILSAAVGFAVQAAEQLYGSGKGQEKKQYVINYLESKGFELDETMIEGIVKELFGRKTTEG